MLFEILPDDDRQFVAYGAISPAFEVRERIDLSRWDNSAPLPVDSLMTSTIKDYDLIPGNAPASWPVRFDVSEWLVLAAYAASRRVGGAIVVIAPAEVVGLGGRPGCGLLWDLRVASRVRGHGVGRALLAMAEVRAREAGCGALDVETQDVNVPACRLYAAAGYQVESITRRAYAELPDEARIVWTKRLG